MSSQKVYDIWLKARKNIDYIIYNSLYKPESEDQLTTKIEELNTEVSKLKKSEIDKLNEEYYLNNYIKLPINAIQHWYTWLKIKLMEYIENTLVSKNIDLDQQIAKDIWNIVKEFMSSSILKYNFILDWLEPSYLIKENYIKSFDNEFILLEIPINEILVISQSKKETLWYFTFDKFENIYSNKSLQFFSEYKSIENGELVFIEDQLGDLPDIWFKFWDLFFLINNIDYSIKQLSIKWNWKWVENDLQTFISRLRKIWI